MASKQITDMPSNFIDETGNVYGDLTVIRYVPFDGPGARWECKCKCGNIAVIRGRLLRNNNVRHCTPGCGRSIHGHSRGGTHSAEYRIWADMWQRCSNPKRQSWPLYGGRGIRVCERWKSFEAFIEDMGFRPSGTYSLDRFPDPDGDYSPDNCRWATASQQANNRRSCRLITFRGRTQTVTEWADEIGISPFTIFGRLKRGWNTDDALTTPVRKQRR